VIAAFSTCWEEYPAISMKTPGTWTLNQLFSGLPAALSLFHAVRTFIESLGPMQTEVMKTQVSFSAKTKFAWVWLPQIWIKKQPEDSIVLTLSLRRHIEDPRIKAVAESRPGRFTHHLVIRHEEDLGDTVRNWIREAYEEHR
jgi:hypothetical protein